MTTSHRLAGADGAAAAHLGVPVCISIIICVRCNGSHTPTATSLVTAAPGLTTGKRGLIAQFARTDMAHSVLVQALTNERQAQGATLMFPYS